MYDCTNIVNPIVSIITSIGYDHMHILGNTLEEIAVQKAGIIKENSDTICFKQEEGVNSVIQKTCEEKNNTLHLIEEKDILNYSYNKDFQKFDYKNVKDIEINLKGIKQINNASICIECVEVLKKRGYEISEKALRDGLKTVVHKGRFETICEKPLIIFDGAHNKPAIENFVNSIKMYYPNNNKVYIISILKTKDYQSVLKQLLKDEKSTFIFTDGNNKQRYVAKEELLQCAKTYTSNSNLFVKSLEEAIDFVKENHKNDVTFIVGSFYVYGTVNEILKKEV